MRAWEATKEDKEKDKREAKKRGISMKKWEASKEDEEMDKAAIKKKMNKKKYD